jgi:hypothetical protein
VTLKEIRYAVNSGKASCVDVSGSRLSFVPRLKCLGDRLAGDLSSAFEQHLVYELEILIGVLSWTGRAATGDDVADVRTLQVRTASVFRKEEGFVLR